MIDFSPIEPFMDDLFYNVVLVLGLPLLIALIVGVGLRMLKLPKLSSGTIASLVFLAIASKMFIKIIS
jgi:hypothetical protein